MSSCMDNWENRFTQDTPEQTIWEIIKGNSEYSAFADLLKETGYDSILRRTSVFTILIPPASDLEQIKGLDMETKTNIIGYHLSNSILYSADIKDIVPLNGNMGTADIIYPFSRPPDAWPPTNVGTYPMHLHDEMSQTAGGGLYMFGSLTDIFFE